MPFNFDNKELATQTLSTLSDWIGEAFNRSDEFLDAFGHNNAWELISVSFTDTNVNLVYVLDSGQHVSDFIKFEAFYSWLTAHLDLA